LIVAAKIKISNQNRMIVFCEFSVGKYRTIGVARLSLP